MTTQRQEDLTLLADVLTYGLRDSEREAFEEMQRLVFSTERVQLSKRQREWVRKVREEHAPSYENAFSAGKVPLGRAIPKLDFEMMPKPLKPPGGRA